MHILRTPDHRFENLNDYPFKPNYTVVKTHDGNDLRIHHLDEGPNDGMPVLCMHGQPAWSYLYRHMIPLLVKQGIRVIAPDLPGYGKSDKPGAMSDYTYQQQVDWMNQWLELNDLRNLTFFGQDWGGLIGLRMIADNPDRFDRIVISNTGLPYNPDTPQEVLSEVNRYRASAKTPSLTQMVSAIRERAKHPAIGFSVWQKFCWETPDMPAGFLMSMMLEPKSALRTALEFLCLKLGIHQISPLQSRIAKAYEAPFPSPAFKMGIRAMPSQVPTLSTDPSLEAQRKAWEFYKGWEKPFLCAFANNDPVTTGGEKPFIAQVPGAHGQDHVSITGGGHFVQEGNPIALANVIANFIHAASPATSDSPKTV